MRSKAQKAFVDKALEGAREERLTQEAMAVEKFLDNHKIQISVKGVKITGSARPRATGLVIEKAVGCDEVLQAIQAFLDEACRVRNLTAQEFYQKMREGQ